MIELSIHRRAWLGLAVLALPTLLLAVDNSVLFLAVAEIGTDLRPTGTQLLWIMDSYGFMIAGFLVTMGTLGDRIGHRKMLMIGGAAFGAASVFAAYAPNAELLLAGRVLLGIAGATLMPATLALIAVLFPDARQRGLAIAVWASCFMAGAALGPVVGGALLEAFWWGSVFLINLPVMALLLVLAPLLLPADRPGNAGRLDLVSVVLSLAAILPVIYGLKELTSGVGVVPVLAVVAGVVFGVLFVRRQRALEHPLLDLGLFADGAFRGALVILLVGTAAVSGLYLVISQFLQLAAGLSPLEAGLWLVPGAVATIAGSLLAPLAARRLRPGVVVALGLAGSTAGFLLLAFADREQGLALAMVGFALAMFGNGPIGALGIDLVVGAVPADRAGGASSLAETGGELGAALGVAVFGSVAAAVYRSSVAGDVPARDAFGDGVTGISWLGAALVAGLAVVAVTALRKVKPTNHSE